ncbi:MAG: cell envelope integrity protein CreD [Steroidobacter sp.]
MGMRLDAASVTVKALMIGLIVLLLLIPLSMLRGVVSERSALREQAYSRVAEGWGGNVALGGPMLIIPTERVVNDKDGTRVVRCDLYLLSALLNVGSTLKLEAEPRYVGIYAVPVYLADVHLTGRFDFASLQPLLEEPGVTYLWAQSRLRLPLSQVRSLREVRTARLGSEDLKLGPAGPGAYRGVDAPVDLTELMKTESAAFDFRVVVAGSREFSILPLGSTTTVDLTSNWPHPSFQGAFLPANRSISEAGFEARWQVLELNRSYAQTWMEGDVDEAMLTASGLGVGLYQPVDVYQRGERAIKYALLFIALTFLTFFTWEQIARIRLHPLQYLLVGLALSMFYLLLIALSEHIAFAIAYSIAAISLVALIGAYIAGALQSSVRGAVAGGAMTAVYGLLYVLVLSEEYALLLGAIVLFSGLAAVMLVTRKLDWYAVSPAAPRTEADHP